MTAETVTTPAPVVVPRWRRYPNLIAVLATLLACAVVVGGHVIRYDKESPWDENVHVDSFYKAKHWHVVRAGELVGQEAAHETACRGVDSPYVPPPCKPGKQLYDPTTFAFGGVNTADLHPPTYYFVTAIVARPISVLPSISSFMTAGRLVGIFWLAGGLLCIWFAGGMLGIAAWPRGIAMALVGSSPAVLHTASTINNDSGVLLGGGLVLLGALRVQQGRRWGTAWLLIAAAFAVLIKATSIVGVGGAAALLVLQAASTMLAQRRARRATTALDGGPDAAEAFPVDGEEQALDAVAAIDAPVSPLRLVLVAIGAVVVAGLASKGWLVLLTHISHASPTPGAKGANVSLTAAFNQFGNFAPPLDNSAYAPFLLAKISWIIVGLKLASVLLLAGPIAALMSPTELPRTRALAGASLLAMYVAPVALFVLLFYTSGGEIAPPARYGLAAVPMIMVVLAMMLRSRMSRVLTTVLASYAIVVVMWAIIANGVPNA